MKLLRPIRFQGQEQDEDEKEDDVNGIAEVDENGQPLQPAAADDALPPLYAAPSVQACHFPLPTSTSAYCRV